MSKPKTYQFDTLSLHAGQQPDPQFGARAQPIYYTTSYVFPDTDHAASLFNMERAGHVYSRISNPTNAALEERIAALEGGVGAIAALETMAFEFGKTAGNIGIVIVLEHGREVVKRAISTGNNTQGGSVNYCKVKVFIK